MLLENKISFINEFYFKGSGLKHLQKNDFKNFKIPLPPLDIQKQSVAECESVESENSRILNEIAEQKEQINRVLAKTGILNVEFQDNEDLKDLPTPQDYNLTEWESVKLKNVAFYPNNKIEVEFLTAKNYVGVDNLLQNKEGKRDADFVLQSGMANEFIKDDILIGNIRPYLKKIWFADIDGGTNGDVIVIRILNKENINSKFLYLILKDDSFFDYDMKHVKGLKMPRGNKEAILNYKFLLPPLEAQEKIVQAINSIEQKISSLQTELNSLNGKQKEILEKYLF